MASLQWSLKKVNLVVGLAAFAAFATLMVFVELVVHRQLSGLGEPGGLAKWTPLVAALWATSFVPKSPTIVGYRKRTTLPTWLVAPWIALWLGPIEWGGALLYYLPMVVGFAAMARVDGRRDDARAVSMPGLGWTRSGEDISLSIPNGAALRSQLASAPEGGVLLRGERGAGSEVELFPSRLASQPLSASVESPMRLVVVCAPDSPQLALWGDEPVQWTLKIAP